MLLGLLSLLSVYSRLTASSLLSDTLIASGTITEEKGRVADWHLKTCPPALPVWKSTGTPYRCSLLTMLLAAVAVLIVRGVPTEHRPSKTSTATAVAVVIRWKLSTAVAMSAAMTVTTLIQYMYQWWICLEQLQKLTGWLPGMQRNVSKPELCHPQGSPLSACISTQLMGSFQ